MFKNIKIKVLEFIQKILKDLIDGKNGEHIPILPDKQVYNSKKERYKMKHEPRIFLLEHEKNSDQLNKENKMTDREKLVEIEESLKSMRTKYRQYKANITGAVATHTNKDVGDMVTKDLDRIINFMQELEKKG